MKIYYKIKIAKNNNFKILKVSKIILDLGFYYKT